MRNSLSFLRNLFLLFSISTVSVAGVWTQKANVPGIGRADGTGTAAGGRGYIGTGYTTGYSTDWYEYNPGTNAWTTKAPFGGAPCVESSCFALNNCPYVLSGPTAIDFWKFDPATNTWTQMATFAGPARQAAVAWAINGLGYITTGAAPTLGGSSDDLWEYDPTANSWLQKANLPGVARHYAAGFSIGNIGYVGTGYSAVTGSNLNDVWAWDQATNTWAPIANFPGAARNEATAFSIGNYGFMGGGYSPLPSGDFYKYDPVSNTWSSIAAFSGGGRVETVSFSIGNSGYLGTGWDGTAFRNDFWEYHEGDPTGLGDDHQLLAKDKFSLFPNPVHNETVLKLDEAVITDHAIYQVLNVNGEEILNGELTGHSTVIQRGNIVPGFYILEVMKDGVRVLRTNFVVE